MSSELCNFQSEWRKRIEDCPEAKQSKANLVYHRRRLKQLQEELTQAVSFEKMLENKVKEIEEQVKPPMMRFHEQLETDNGVDDEVVERTVIEDDPDTLTEVLRKKAVNMDKMNRTQLLAFMKTLFSVRDRFLERDNEAGVEAMQSMAGAVVKQLGRVTISWLHLDQWEVDLLRTLIREVEGVPEFAVRMLDQILTKCCSNSNSSNNSSSVVGRTSTTGLSVSLSNSAS